MLSHHFPPHYSGAAKQAISLAKQLKKLGIETFFITVENGKLKRRDKFDGFDIYRIREGKGSMKELILWWNLLKLLYKKRKHYDIIHSHGAYYKNSIIGLAGRLLKKGTVIKVSMSKNDLSGIGKGLFGRIHSVLFKMVDSCVSISSEITSELNEVAPSHRRIIEIPNGVDTDQFKPVSDEHKQYLREKLKLPLGLIFLYVGGISVRKNVEWLIKTWSKTYADKEGISLIIVGPPSCENRKRVLFDSLTEYVAQNELTQKVIFRDYTAVIEEYFQASDIFILPSKKEGMPNVLVEAMSCGLTCLTTKVSGTSRLIVDNETGLFFDTDSNGDFHSATLRLKDNPDERQRIGKAARKLILEKYSLDKISRKYADLYSDLLMFKPSRF